MDYAVKLSNVTKKFKGDIVAVSNINYCFEPGKLYTIQGASGSGKSTLLQMIGTLDNPTQGTVEIYGQSMSHCNDRQKAQLRNQKIGFVFQSYMLNPKLRAYENVMLPMLATNKKSKDCEKQAYKLLRSMGLEDRLKHYPYQLSGGEQQRVSVARALANNPSILLADEPTGSLDSENEVVLIQKLKKMAQSGVCVIVVTHNQAVLEYADQVLTMSNGNMIDSSGNEQSENKLLD